MEKTFRKDFTVMINTVVHLRDRITVIRIWYIKDIYEVQLVK